MIRWLGGLTGGALAIGAIVLFVGLPRFVDLDASERASGDRVPVPASAPTPAPAATPAPEPAAAVVAQPVEPAASLPGDDAVLPAERDPQPIVTPSKSVEPVEPVEPVEAVEPVEPVELVEPAEQVRWHAFWSPFRSQIAANGFVSQLQNVTALDYRVVTVKPGVYEVAFGYEDETEIAGKLSQIAAATGLDVPES